MPGLGVNIDHVATIRQARRTVEPDPVWAAVEAELGGADCITFHLRKDRRHINDRDARLLRQTVRCKLNMEMSLDEEIVAIALELKPAQASLVPENRQEITTEGGLDVAGQFKRVSKVTAELKKAGVIVSAFIDPVDEQIRASAKAGCDAIEIHTGAYANASTPVERAAAVQGHSRGPGNGAEGRADRARRARADVQQHCPDRRDGRLQRIQHRAFHRVAGGVRGPARGDG